MPVILALLLGTFIGWVGSLVARSDSNVQIIIHMLVGALGAIIMALALGDSSKFDSVVAAFLGAFLAVAVLFLVRRGLAPRSD